MMKFTLLVLAAAATATQANDETILFPTQWGDWVWCCGDSEGRCPDACARVNPPNPTNSWWVEYGPESQKFADQQSGAEEPDLVGFPDGFYFDADFVQAKCVMIHGFLCNGGSGLFGDPHFKTWSGQYYDYHGQCELNFLHAPDFGNGVGLDIHVRTKIKNFYSFVESAAIKIGDDVLEIGSWGEYFLNGVEDAELPAMLGGYPVAYYQRSEKEHVFDIFLGDDRRILIKNLKEWVSIHIDNPKDLDFVTSSGLLGDFMTGDLLSRSGEVMTDHNEFGQEWQVQPDEPQLFITKEYQPVHPAKCVLPSEDFEAFAERRRLSEANGVTEEQAEAACAHMPAHKEFCIKDVMATGDLDMAGAF